MNLNLLLRRASLKTGPHRHGFPTIGLCVSQIGNAFPDRYGTSVASEGESLTAFLVLLFTFAEQGQRTRLERLSFEVLPSKLYWRRLIGRPCYLEKVMRR